MKDAVILLGGIVGGLFLGYLAAVVAYFVWQLIKEGFGDSMRMAIPALLLLGVFGTALIYLARVVFESWPVLIGAATAFVSGARRLFKAAE